MHLSSYVLILVEIVHFGLMCICLGYMMCLIVFFFCLVQLTSTVLHVLILTSSSDHEPIKDFLVKVSVSYTYIELTWPSITFMVTYPRVLL